MPTSNIDDLLLGAKSPQHPQTPEHEYQEGPEEVEGLEPEDDEPEGDHVEDSGEAQDEEEERKPEHKKEYDDYGNEKEPENEAIRDRLARQARKHQAEIDALRIQLEQQGASREVQQAAKDFQYDPESKSDWQQQLAQFVRQEVSSMTREDSQRKQQAVEQQSYTEFQNKFREGMDRFDDFIEVVEGKPLDDAMTSALRGISDPAAFLYAAAKRNPQELERISKLLDPHQRHSEMIRLEDRMRRNKPTTKAPRPLSRNTEDASIPQPKNKGELSIEQLIAQSDSKKLGRIKSRRGGSR